MPKVVGQLSPEQLKRLQSQSGFSTPQMQNEQSQDPNLANKLADFFAPRMKEYGKVSMDALSLRGNTPQLDKFSTQSFDNSRKLIELAKNETDPIKKQQLLEQSRQIDRGASSTINTFFEDKGLERTDRELSPVRLGAGVAGEVGTYIAPAGGKSASLSGAIFGATDPNNENAKEAATNALVNAVTMGVFSKGSELAAKGVSKGKNAALDYLSEKAVAKRKGVVQKLVNKMWTPTTSKLQKFDALEGSDFAEMFVNKDLQEVAKLGNDDKAIRSYFKGKAKLSTSETDTYLKQFDNVSKEEVIDLIDNKIKEVNSTDSLNKEEVLKELKSVKAKLSDFKQIDDLATVNQIRRDLLQSVQSTEFTKGQSQTSAGSTAVENLRKELADFIESKGATEFKNYNKNTQYYRAADEAVNYVTSKDKKAYNEITKWLSGGGSATLLAIGLYSQNPVLIAAAATPVGFKQLTENRGLNTKVANKLTPKGVNSIVRKEASGNAAQRLNQIIGGRLSDQFNNINNGSQ